MGEVFNINLWINEDRWAKIKDTSVAERARDVLAGLMAIEVPANEGQKDQLLKRYTMAKCDTSTTKTIELLPRAAKDAIFNLVAAKKSVEVLDDFLASPAS